MDDSAWATSTNGRLFVVDAKLNATYIIRANFKAGQAYTEAPSDSGVAGFVGTLGLTTGTITPIAVGFGSPSGLIYVPN